MADRDPDKPEALRAELLGSGNEHVPKTKLSTPSTPTKNTVAADAGTALPETPAGETKAKKKKKKSKKKKSGQSAPSTPAIPTDSEHFEAVPLEADETPLKAVETEATAPLPIETEPVPPSRSQSISKEGGESPAQAKTLDSVEKKSNDEPLDLPAERMEPTHVSDDAGDADLSFDVEDALSSMQAAIANVKSSKTSSNTVSAQQAPPKPDALASINPLDTDPIVETSEAEAPSTVVNAVPPSLDVLMKDLELDSKRPLGSTQTAAAVPSSSSTSRSLADPVPHDEPVEHEAPADVEMPEAEVSQDADKPKADTVLPTAPTEALSEPVEIEAMQIQGKLDDAASPKKEKKLHKKKSKKAKSKTSGEVKPADAPEGSTEVNLNAASMDSTKEAKPATLYETTSTSLESKREESQSSVSRAAATANDAEERLAKETSTGTENSAGDASAAMAQALETSAEGVPKTSDSQAEIAPDDENVLDTGSNVSEPPSTVKLTGVPRKTRLSSLKEAKLSKVEVPEQTTESFTGSLTDPEGVVEPIDPTSPTDEVPVVHESVTTDAIGDVAESSSTSETTSAAAHGDVEDDSACDKSSGSQVAPSKSQKPDEQQSEDFAPTEPHGLKLEDDTDQSSPKATELASVASDEAGDLSGAAADSSEAKASVNEASAGDSSPSSKVKQTELVISEEAVPSTVEPKTEAHAEMAVPSESTGEDKDAAVARKLTDATETDRAVAMEPVAQENIAAPKDRQEKQSDQSAQKVKGTVETKPEKQAPSKPPKATAAPDPQTLADEKAVYLYVSLSSGGRGAMSNFNRASTILKSYEIDFVPVEITMDEKAKRLWKYQGIAKNKKLPAVVRDREIKLDFDGLIEANEFEEVYEMVFDDV